MTEIVLTRKSREAGNAIGSGRKPGKLPPRLKPETTSTASPGESALWDDLHRQWELDYDDR